jgi:hypothetical protein
VTLASPTNRHTDQQLCMVLGIDDPRGRDALRIVLPQLLHRHPTSGRTVRAVPRSRHRLHRRDADQFALVPTVRGTRRVMGPTIPTPALATNSCRGTIVSAGTAPRGANREGMGDHLSWPSLERAGRGSPASAVTDHYLPNNCPRAVRDPVALAGGTGRFYHRAYYLPEPRGGKPSCDKGRGGHDPMKGFHVGHAGAGRSTPVAPAPCTSSDAPFQPHPEPGGKLPKSGRAGQALGDLPRGGGSMGALTPARRLAA